MHFVSSLVALVASAAVASAASVTFWTLDNVERTIIFTGNPGAAEIAPVTVSSGKHRVEFPDVWVGNFYAVQKDQPLGQGMLGEVAFGAWGGLTYFDVSAIVNPNDKDNVKQMWPAKSLSPVHGCEVFPCSTAYYLPDDVQTQTTHENDLVATLGAGTPDVKFPQSA